MRTAVISDLHSNVDALAGVLQALSKESVSEIICLGDVVGYNAFPMETIILLQRAGVASVLGNHDLMVLGRVPSSSCGPRGRRAVEWTVAELSPAERRFLEALPQELHRRNEVLFLHSTLGDSVARLLTPSDFEAEHQRLVARFPGLRICFTGHTHEQAVREVTPLGGVQMRSGDEIRLDPGSFFFVNPGSVGEPRGTDKRAAFAIFDTDRSTIAFKQIPYDRSRVLRENARRGLGSPASASIVTRMRGLVKFATSLVTSRDS